MTRIPFLLYGDGPRLHSGLARIARDIAARLVAREEELGIRFAQVGVDWPGGWQWQPWDLWGFQPVEFGDQGRAAVFQAAQDLQNESGVEPIIFMIMDPSRCYDLLRQARDARDVDNIDARWWGYFPIDAHNVQEGVGGPAAQTLAECDRVLAYGRYGARVINRTLANFPGYTRNTAVPYLPHGLEPGAFRPDATLDDAHFDFAVWATGVSPAAIKIGCVATNQPRKDLGLLFSAMAALKAQGHQVALWLHTDVLTKVWSISELAFTCGLQKHEVAVSTAELTDRQLSAQYAWSDVTLAPGLGEGFGYPIVESLACGTPVVHPDYAGGVELIPNRDWLVQPAAWRLESVYAVQRPVLNPQVVAETLYKAASWKRDQGTVARAACAGSVEYLSWKHLWPRWERWIRAGVETYRRTLEEQHGSSRAE